MYLIVDGHNLLHRVVYATGGKDFLAAASAFLRSLSSFITADSPLPIRSMMVVWDGGRSQRRLKLYPEYKAARDRGDRDKREEVVNTFLGTHELLRLVLPAFGVRSCTLGGREADDVIAHVIDLLDGQYSIVLSNDRDFLQLASTDVGVWIPDKCDHIPFEKPPHDSREAFLIYKALLGDTSDNIRGVPQIGEKRANFAVELFDGKDLSNESIGRFFDACRECNSAPIKRIPDHAVTLFRNLALMDLRRERFSEEEDKHIHTLFEMSVRTNPRGAAIFVYDRAEGLPNNKIKKTIEEMTLSMGNFERLI